MAEIGVTEIDATSQDLVAALVQETLKQSAVILPSVTNYSQFAVKGAKSVSIPRRDQFTAADKTENSALTAQEITFSADQIDLNKHKAVLASLEEIAAIQANVAVEAEIMMEMARELALQLDRDIYTELKLASAAAPDHRIAFANATDLQKVDILESRKLLNDQNVPQADRRLLVNPLHEKELLSIDDFVSTEKYGNSSAVMNGELGRLFGFSVLMSTVVEDNNVIAYHTSAVGYATQMAPSLKRQDDLPKLAEEFVLSWIYGSKVLDTGKRQVLVGTAT